MCWWLYILTKASSLSFYYLVFLFLCLFWNLLSKIGGHMGPLFYIVLLLVFIVLHTKCMFWNSNNTMDRNILIWLYNPCFPCNMKVCITNWLCWICTLVWCQVWGSIFVQYAVPTSFFNQRMYSFSLSFSLSVSISLSCLGRQNVYSPLQCIHLLILLLNRPPFDR